MFFLKIKKRVGFPESIQGNHGRNNLLNKQKLGYFAMAMRFMFIPQFHSKRQVIKKKEIF